MKQAALRLTVNALTARSAKGSFFPTIRAMIPRPSQMYSIMDGFSPTAPKMSTP